MTSKKVGIALLALFLLAFAIPLQAAEFDWRAYPGDANLPAGNYITPVRNQGSAGTCWAFAAVGALEAKYDITFKVTNSTLNLSEQHLVCDGSAGDVDGGWEDYALDFIRDHGITTEATLPYTASNYSPNWPLTEPYTLYRITHDQHWYTINPAPTPLKSYILANGPVTAAIDADTDWYTPSNPPHYSSTDGGQLGSYDIPPGVLLDDHGDPNSLNHAVVITGYTDDSNAPGGGYWHIKNSWGSTWGPTHDGYGYVSFSTMQADDYITGIDGVAFVQIVPEPAALILLGMSMMGVLVWRRRNRG